jgi:CheY-like chemotaxis protein
MGERSASIFYIEDSPGDILLIRTAFVEFGRHVTFEIALDGQAALRRLEAFANRPATRPDLILLDLNLPGLSGFEVLAHLRNGISLPVPVVVLTTSRAEADRARCDALGCASYLEKPTRFSDYRGLVKEIERMLLAA